MLHLGPAGLQAMHPHQREFFASMWNRDVQVPPAHPVPTSHSQSGDPVRGGVTGELVLELVFPIWGPGP